MNGYLPGIEPPAADPVMVELVPTHKTRSGTVHLVVDHGRRHGMTWISTACRDHVTVSGRGINVDSRPRGCVTCAKCLGKPKPIPTNTCTPAKPGTGPAEETCKTCLYAVRTKWAGKAYRKCDLAQSRWTRGGATDIKLWWPACSSWSLHPGHAPKPVLAIAKRYGVTNLSLADHDGATDLLPMSDEIEEAGFPGIANWLRKRLTEGATR